MQKVYLLLRDNQQTGPYTLDEILQLHPRAFDLVWVEGQSAAWRYPGEIPSLKAYVAPTPLPGSPFEPIATAVMEQQISEQPPSVSTSKTEAPPRVFVSMPGAVKEPDRYREEALTLQHTVEDPISQKAEELSRRVQAYAEQNKTPEQFKPAPVVEFNEPAYRYPVSNKRKLRTKDLVILAGIAVASISGYFILSGDSNPEKPVSQSTNTPIALALDNPVEQVPLVDEPELSVADVNEKQPVKQTVDRKKNTTPVPGKKTKVPDEGRINEPVVAVVLPEPSNEEKKIIPDPVEEKKEVAPPSGTKKEKKKLRDVVKGIFRTRDKKTTNEDEEITEEAPQSATDRQAQKRKTDAADENVEQPDLARLAELVDLSSNAPDNWMMGVKDLKITLRNRNDVALHSASVVVSYFDDNNQLLEKKTVQFYNVPARGKMTLPAPDHKWADHTKLSLGNISTRKDAYAKD